MDQVDRLRAALADRYELGSEIGSGGMARVYRAHDRQHDRDVAVKVLRPELAPVLGTERFLREIRIEARLQHPHILPLYDSGVADGFPYYVMPYVEGETLRDRIRREKQLSLTEALGIARDVADALDYAHAHDVLHRDIKPANILLNGEHAMVADFGIAKAIAEVDEEALTGTGVVIGTPEYMSPEQGSGEHSVGRRSDIYALGCVLYEMLAGEPPFTGRTAQAVLARHLHESPPPLRVVRPNIPPAIERAVERALAKVPADRFATAAAFADSLDPELATEERRPPRSWSRRAVPMALPLGLTALLGVVGIVWWGSLRHPPTTLGVIIAPFEGTSGDSLGAAAMPAHGLFGEALEWVPDLHVLDGGRLLVSGGGTRAPPLSDMLRRARHLGARYLVTGAVRPEAGGARVTVDLYSVVNGERLVRGADTSMGARLDGVVGRLAMQAIRAMAEREHLDLGARKAMFSATSSARALGELIQGQTQFSQGDYDAAAAAFARAIEADSTCGVAYLRLSDAQSFRFEYAAALATLQAGLRQRARLPVRWVNLLEARRDFALGHGDSAIAAFQSAVLDDREDIDAWLGLGESLFHLAAYSGHSPLEAQGALERTVELDSAFFPIYDHLVDLALYQGDAKRAAKYVRRMPRGEAATVARQEAIVLRFGRGAARREALRRLRGVDRQALSQLVLLWSLGAADLPLADTIASFLSGSNRTPDDRLRGAEYRLVALAGQGRWPEALAQWQHAGSAQPFDAWVVQAYLAGYPAKGVAGPMFEWARLQMSRGIIPDFTLPPWDERQQGFQALVHRATLAGDSAEVTDLLRRMETARRSADPTDPTAASLQATLQARLDLLARDSTRAIASLRRSLASIYHPFTWYYPLTSMAPQRRLLSELLQAHGASVEAKRWRDSFHNSWSIGDVLFAVRAHPAGRRAGG